MNVLIVEDDRDFADYLTKALPDHKCEIAPDAKTAIATLRERRFDAVICDLVLPDADPKQTLAMIRAHCGRAPIIAITGMAGDIGHLFCDAFAHKTELRTPEAVAGILCAATNQRCNRPSYEAAVDTVQAIAEAFCKHAHA